MDQCAPPYFGARKRVQPSRLLRVNSCVTGPLNRVLSIMGAQIPPKGFAPKARLRGAEGCAPLALHERHGALLSESRERDIGLLDSATFLLTEMPVQAFVRVSMDNLDEVGLNTRDKPEATLYAA